MGEDKEPRNLLAKMENRKNQQLVDSTREAGISKGLLGSAETSSNGIYEKARRGDDLAGFFVGRHSARVPHLPPSIIA